MALPDLPDSSLPAPGLGTATETSAAAMRRPGRPHLVVVLTRGVRPEDGAAAGAVLVTRFWHPRDHRWSVNYFDSLEHALRLFLDESGWTLRQQQDLAESHEHELIFEARRDDFTGPSTEEILQEVGLTPDDVSALLDMPPGPVQGA